MPNHPKQIKLAERVSKKLTEKGYKIEMEYDSVIDIIVEIGTERSTNYSKGIFRVFWSRTNDFELGYLRAGEPYSDGYEIRRDWFRNIDLKQVIKLVEDDVNQLSKFHIKQNEMIKSRYPNQTVEFDSNGNFSIK